MRGQKLNFCLIVELQADKAKNNNNSDNDDYDNDDELKPWTAPAQNVFHSLFYIVFLL